MERKQSSGSGERNRVEEEEEEEEAIAMIVEREELMIPPPTTSGGIPTLRKAHFLKPLLNPKTDQPLPKLCSNPSLSLNPQLTELIKKRVHFIGRIKRQKAWKTWVDDLQQTHQDNWKKVGIFDAIRASTCKISKDNELIIALAEKWCPQTNTFIFPWGESTITLEDIMILGGFSVLGVSVQSPCETAEFEEMEKKLFDAYKEIKRSSNYTPVSNRQWMNYFKGGNGEMENAALIVLWLSRYVLLTNAYYCISPNVFDIAVNLARGTRVALAPAVLASIYRDLSLLREKIVALTNEGGDNGLDLNVFAPFHLVQLWAWERFPRLSPKPLSLVPGEPRLACWHRVNKVQPGRPRLGIEFAGDDFLWRPYTLSLKNWEFPKFYSDQEMWVLVNSEVDEELLPFARCLMPCELLGVDCVAEYLPHRVAMQFGLDQDIPDFIHRSNDNYVVAWNSYGKPLDGLKFFIPPRLFEGDVTVKYANWWRVMFSLHDEALVVCERRKRSARRVKKMSQILLGREEGNSWEKFIVQSPFFKTMPSQDRPHVGDEDELSSLVDIPVMVIGDTEQCEHIANDGVKETEVQGNSMNIDNGSKHPEGSDSQNESSPANNESVSVKEPLLGPDVQKFCCAVAGDEPSKDVEDTIMSIREPSKVIVTFTKPLMGADVTKFPCAVAEDEPRKDVEDTIMSVTEPSKEIVSVAEPLTDPDIKNFSCAEDEPSKDVEGTLMKQVNNSADDIVVLDDVEEEKVDYDCFISLVSGIDARVTKLESVVSSLKAAKLGSNTR